MMTLYELGLWSIIGSLLFLLMCGIKPFTKKLFSYSWQYYTSLTPVAFLLGVSLITVPAVQLLITALNQYVTKIAGEGAQIAEPILGIASKNDSGVLAVSRSISESVKQGFQLSGSYLLFIWAVGVVVFLIVKIRSNCRFRRSIIVDCKKLLLTHNGVRVVKSGSVTTPMLIGLFKPMIVLPDVKMSEKEREIILLHEFIHFKRGDLIVKLLVLFANALHWFNPIAYLMTREIDFLCERSCDEKLVHNLDQENRKFYSQTILSMLERSKVQQMQRFSMGLCSSKKKIERRLLSIMKFKKMKKPIAFISVVAAISILGVGSALANEYQPSQESTKGETVTVDHQAPDETDVSTPAETESTWMWPVKDRSISYAYGQKEGTTQMHHGIDFVADYGTDIVAADDGVVLQLVGIADKDNHVQSFFLEGEDGVIPEGMRKINTSWGASYGRLIVLKHGDGRYQTWYGHCSKLLVEAGDIVKKGDVIAQVGSTGRATGNHLHFEIRQDGGSVNPADIIKK